MGSAAYLFELQLGPPAHVGIGIQGCYYATSNGRGIHLGDRVQAWTYRSCVLIASRQKGGLTAWEDVCCCRPWKLCANPRDGNRPSAGIFWRGKDAKGTND